MKIDSKKRTRWNRVIRNLIFYVRNFHTLSFGKMIVAGALTVFLSIFGIYYSYIGMSELVLAQKSKSWISTQGMLEKISYSSNSSSGHNTGAGNARGAPSVDITYKYMINNRSLYGERIMFGYVNNFFTSDSYRRSEIYHKGASVLVYYNPDNIKQSVLEPGIHFPYSFNKLIIGLLVILFYYFIYFKNDVEEKIDLETTIKEGWIGKMYEGCELEESCKKDKEK